MNVILASASPYRQALLADVGVQAAAIGADVDEYAIIGDTPVETAQLRARAKANFIFEQYPDAVVIGADQVCYLDAEVLDKPTSDEQWLERLKRMRGRGHEISTAVCIRIPTGFCSDSCKEFVETTKVYFRKDLTDADLEKYVAIGEARGCAGGYMMERRGAWLIMSIAGDWQNVIGLPVFPVLRVLQSIGLPIFGQ